MALLRRAELVDPDAAAVIMQQLNDDQRSTRDQGEIAHVEALREHVERTFIARREGLPEPSFSFKGAAASAAEIAVIDDQSIAFWLDFARDQKAGHVVGRLELRGALMDPGLRRSEDPRERKEAAQQSRRRYDALTRFAAEYFAVFGRGSAPSHLRNMITGLGPPIDGDDDAKAEASRAALELRVRSKIAQAEEVEAAGPVQAITVLRWAALWEIELEPLEVITLRRVADAIGAKKRDRHFHEGNPALEALETNREKSNNSRRRGLPVEFSPATSKDLRPGKDAVAASLRTLRGKPRDG